MKFCTLCLCIVTVICWSKHAAARSHNSSFSGIRSCCRKDEIYSYDTRECVKSSEKNETFLVGLFKNKGQVKMKRGKLRCEHGVVDHNIETSNLFVQADSIKIKSRSGVITLPQSTTEFCFDQSSPSLRTVVARICEPFNNCNKNVCITKCTVEKYNVALKGNETVTVTSKKRSLHSAIFLSNSYLSNERFGKIRNTIRSNPEYTLMIQADTCEIPYYVQKQWHMTENGYIRVEDHKKQYKSHRYCVDVIDNPNNAEDDILLYVCLELKDYSVTTVSIFRGVLLITSCVFILVTITVQIIVPSFRNTYGKCSLQHCICYFIAFFCVAMGHFRVLEKTKICVISGYITLFFSISIFSWLNILCYLIWNGIGRGMAANLEFRNKRGSFVYYNIYAWGIAVVLLTITIIADNLNLPDLYKPNINGNECWFPKIDSFAEFIYFTIPTSILTVINIIFFILTTINFNRAKSDIYKIMKRNSATDINQTYREQFYTSLKLLFMMGIPLIGDTVVSMLWYFNSAVFDTRISMVFAVIKALNSLQGVILFLIMVGKKKIWVDLKKICVRRLQHYSWHLKMCKV